MLGTLVWDEENPEVLPGEAFILNCGPAGGVYTAISSADLASVQAMIEEHNTEIAQIQVSAQADLAQWNAGTLSTEEYERREAERAAALAEIEGQQQHDVAEGIPEGGS